MLGFATIRKDGFPKVALDRQRWRSLIGELPELRRLEFLTVGSERYPAPDSAELVEDGKVIGNFIWENGQIYVDGPYSMFPLAKGIADILDAYVFDDTGEEMLETPSETINLEGERPVHYQQYDQPLNLLGRDLFSLLTRTKDEVAALVGRMSAKSEMPTVTLPVKAITSMTGETADEVHEWPNATQGEEFHHLVLHFLNERLVGFRMSFRGSAPAASPATKPWWKFW
jgi:hypothetical protein